MKTTINIKKAFQLIIVATLIVSSVIITRNMIRNVKQQYSMLPAGSGKAFFYGIIQ